MSTEKPFNPEEFEPKESDAKPPKEPAEKTGGSPKAKRPDPGAERRNTPMPSASRPLSPAEQDRVHRHGSPR